jgi:hypothetical protein
MGCVSCGSDRLVLVGYRAKICAECQEIQPRAIPGPSYFRGEMSFGVAGWLDVCPSCDFPLEPDSRNLRCSHCRLLGQRCGWGWWRYFIPAESDDNFPF